MEQMTFMMLMLVPGTLISSIIATVVVLFKLWRPQQFKQEPPKSALLVLVLHHINSSSIGNKYLLHSDKSPLSIPKVRRSF